MFRRALVVSTLLLLAGPETMWAQRFEVAPYVGYRLGGTFTNVSDPTNPAVTALKADNSLAFGIVADVRITGVVYIEAFFDRQPTTFKADIPNNPIDLFDVKIDWYHIGLRFETPRQDEPKPQGFLSVTFGATNFIPESGYSGETKASFGASLGGEYFFHKNVGAMLLGRYVATFFNSGDQYFCLDEGPCFNLPSSTTFHQFEISGGVSVAF